MKLDLKEIVEGIIQRQTDLRGFEASLVQELIQYDCLHVMHENGYLSRINFQGGSALRFMYGNKRFSQDLDFAGGKDFDAKSFKEMGAKIKAYLEARYPVEVYVKEPKTVETGIDPDGGWQNSAWQVRINTAPNEKGAKKKILKLEVGNVPTYTQDYIPLSDNASYLPDGYEFSVPVQSLEEILADKLVAFPNVNLSMNADGSITEHFRMRDIWDISFILKHVNTLPVDLIIQKLRDYHYEKEDYLNAVLHIVERLDDIVTSHEFKIVMEQTLERAVYNEEIAKEEKLLLLAELLRETYGDIVPKIKETEELTEEEEKAMYGFVVSKVM